MQNDYWHAYYAKNRASCLARSKAWAQANPDKVSDASRRYRTKNPEKSRQVFRNQRTKKRIFIQSMKMRPCMDCSVQHDPWVMQFDHRDPLTKTQDVHRMTGWSLLKIKLEIEKCDVVCANCHAQRTYKGAHWNVRREPLATEEKNLQGEFPLTD